MTINTTAPLPVPHHLLHTVDIGLCGSGKKKHVHRPIHQFYLAILAPKKINESLSPDISGKADLWELEDGTSDRRVTLGLRHH